MSTSSDHLGWKMSTYTRKTMERAVFEEICTNVHFDGNVRYKRPVWKENDYLTCFRSCPCTFLRCWLRFLGLVNGSAAPLLHPATGHGNGPTLSGLPGHTLQCSLLLLAFRKSPAPHPSHFLSAFFNLSGRSSASSSELNPMAA